MPHITEAVVSKTLDLIGNWELTGELLITSKLTAHTLNIENSLGAFLVTQVDGDGTFNYTGILGPMTGTRNAIYIGNANDNSIYFESSRHRFRSLGAGTTFMEITTNGVRVRAGGALRAEIEVGATDSGGSGYRVLRVPN